MANPVDTVIDHHITKEREPANVPNYHTNHPSKVILKILPNRLKHQAGKIITEEIRYPYFKKYHIRNRQSETTGGKI